VIDSRLEANRAPSSNGGAIRARRGCARCAAASSSGTWRCSAGRCTRRGADGVTGSAFLDNVASTNGGPFATTVIPWRCAIRPSAGTRRSGGAMSLHGGALTATLANVTISGTRLRIWRAGSGATARAHGRDPPIVIWSGSIDERRVPCSASVEWRNRDRVPRAVAPDPARQIRSRVPADRHVGQRRRQRAAVERHRATPERRVPAEGRIAHLHGITVVANGPPLVDATLSRNALPSPPSAPRRVQRPAEHRHVPDEDAAAHLAHPRRRPNRPAVAARRPVRLNRESITVSVPPPSV